MLISFTESIRTPANAVSTLALLLLVAKVILDFGKISLYEWLHAADVGKVYFDVDGKAAETTAEALLETALQGVKVFMGDLPQPRLSICESHGNGKLSYRIFLPDYKMTIADQKRRLQRLGLDKNRPFDAAVYGTNQKLRMVGSFKKPDDRRVLKFLDGSAPTEQNIMDTIVQYTTPDMTLLTEPTATAPPTPPPSNAAPATTSASTSASIPASHILPAAMSDALHSFGFVNVRPLKRSPNFKGFLFDCNNRTKDLPCPCCRNVHENNGFVCFDNPTSYVFRNWSQRCKHVRILKVADIPLDQAIRECIHPTIDIPSAGFGVVRYNAPYVLPFNDEISSYKHLLLRAPMGTGKTTQLKAALVKLQPSSVLIITPRTIFARSMFGTLQDILPELCLYKDIPGDDRAPEKFMVCQLESLHSLGKSVYDLLILDECESILYQFGAPTISLFDAVVDVFENVVSSAGHVLWLDAFLGDRSLRVCALMDPCAPRVFIHNQHKQDGRIAYHLSTGRTAKQRLLDAATHLAGERNVCVTASKGLAQILEQGFNKADAHTLVIHADTSDHVKAQLEDVNHLLIPYKNFIYTSAITVGNTACGIERTQQVLHVSKLSLPQTIVGAASRHSPM